MSVIVWDGVVLASDSVANDGHVLFPIVKFAANEDNTQLIACCGKVSDVTKYWYWYNEHKCELAKFPQGISNEGTMVIVMPRMGLVRYTNSGNPCLHGNNKVAFGSGRDFAYGALYTGASSFLAVEAAIKYCVTCGGDVLYAALNRGNQ